jgi:hypothetical protein
VVLTFGIKVDSSGEKNLVWLFLLLIVLFYPHATIVWHGEANDIGRHALLASVHLRLGFWLLLIALTDILLMQWYMRRNIVPRK